MVREIEGANGVTVAKGEEYLKEIHKGDYMQTASLTFLYVYQCLVQFSKHNKLSERSL